MSKLGFRVIGLTAVIALLGVASYAIAGGGSKNFKGKEMNGYAENPDISTVATGSFKARLSEDGTKLAYELSYSGLEGTVQQAHIHFAKRGVNGGISIWLCGTAGFVPPTAGIPTCVQSGTVTGEVDKDDVIGPAGQGIAAGEFAEILAAMRAGRAYANVHSSKFPSGEIRAQINDRRGGDDKKGDDD
jgi:hypothetical protein